MTETYLATKQELKKHHLSEVQKQFKYFEPMMSLNKNEHAFYLGSTINSTVKLPNNPFQKFIITDYNINVNDVKVMINALTTVDQAMAQFHQKYAQQRTRICLYPYQSQFP